MYVDFLTIRSYDHRVVAEVINLLKVSKKVSEESSIALVQVSRLMAYQTHYAI